MHAFLLLLALQLSALTAGPASGQSAGLPAGSIADSVVEAAPARTAATKSLFAHPWTLAVEAVVPAADARAVLQGFTLPARLTSMWNGALPREVHEGALWSGRGAGVSLRGGVGLRRGPLVLLVAHEIAWAQNRPFDLIPSRDASRSSFASPFHGTGAHSLDWPLRPGTQSVARITPGWTSLHVDIAAPRLGGALRTGATASPLAWGPALRNGLLLSPHGPGIPRVFVEGAHRTRWGTFDWQLITGVLVESLHFDRDDANDQRVLGGFVLGVSPRWTPGVTFGGGRLTVAPTEGVLSLGQLVGAPFRSTGYAVRENDDGTVSVPSADGLTMAFARWQHAELGVQLGVEMAWQEPPSGLRSWLTHAAHTRAWNVSVAWTPPEGHRHSGTYVRAEVASLDLDRERRELPPPSDFYSGRAAVQGFTQQGRLLGAPIGPGGQSLWVEAGRRVRPWLTLGGTGSWTRFHNDAFSREPLRNFTRRDAALEGGVQVGASWRGHSLGLEAGVQRRVNHLFQNGFANPLGLRTVSATNPFVVLTLDWRP